MKKQDFFNILLTCGENQAIALLETLDKSQVSALVYLFYNIRENKSCLSAQSRGILSKNQTIFSKLLNKKNSEKKNYLIIRNNSEKFYSILKSTRKVLLKVLK